MSTNHTNPSPTAAKTHEAVGAFSASSDAELSSAHDIDFGFAVMKHLGVDALTGGKISPYKAFELGWGAGKLAAATTAEQTSMTGAAKGGDTKEDEGVSLGELLTPKARREAFAAPAVPEGVNTAELPGLPRAAMISGRNLESLKAWYTAEQMAQQREAGRRERQAEIDRLMLEFCPDEMSEPQKAEWEASQRATRQPVAPELTDEQEPKYGGSLFNRASGETIPPDEPVFIFRARDIHAPDALEEYASVLTPGPHRDAVVQRLCDFADFAHAHPERMKEPDTDRAILAASPKAEPINMILHCPKCGLQHVDEPDERTADWTNPPHRSHLCHGCNHIWRPADVPTNGVAAIKTVGKADSPKVAVVEPVELVGVQQQLDENAGFWHTCSGCHDTEDGHPTGNYTHSAVMRCALGTGCAECGGLGAVWDNNDYSAALERVLAVEQVSDDKRDAERYRKLRMVGDEWQNLSVLDFRGDLDAEALDEAVDALAPPQPINHTGDAK